MSYLVFARKYRPQTFEEVVGQEAVATTLRNAITADRVAHAYLFCGPRGVGKTSMARIFSKALNCTNGSSASPCNECDICKKISIGEDLDVSELDGASNRGIDEVRQIRDSVRYAPNRSHYKIYIIDEVHMLTKEAFNALLKTLEEPPSHVKFIFATTEVHRIPETILSRCQRFDFKRITMADIVSRLQQICEAEQVKAGEDVLKSVARAASGAMRDSQSLLDKLISFGRTELTMDDVREIQGAASFESMAHFVDLLLDKNASEALLEIDRALEGGSDLGEFLNQLTEHMRILMLIGVGGDQFPLLELTEEELQRASQQSRKISLDSVLYHLQVLEECRSTARTAGNLRTVLEMAVVKMATMEDLQPITAVIERLSLLEQSIKGLPPVSPPTIAGQEQATATVPQKKNESSAVDAGARAGCPESPVPVTEPPVPPEEPAELPEQKVQAPAQADTLVSETGDGAIREPEPEQVPAGLSLSFDEVRRSWEDIVTRVQEADAMLGTQLARSRPMRLEEHQLHLGFAAQDSFHCEAVSSLTKKQLIEDIIRAVLGKPVRVRAEIVSGEELNRHSRPEAHASNSEALSGSEDAIPAEEPRPMQLPDDLKDHPMVKKVAAAFEADVVRIYGKEEQE